MPSPPFTLTIDVSDGIRRSAPQTVIVNLTNVNEAPVITSHGGGASASLSVAENTTAVTTVTATDPDAGQTLSYSITGGADATKFTINASTGVLTFVTAPNFESPTDANADNVYLVQVTASPTRIPGAGTTTNDEPVICVLTSEPSAFAPLRYHL